MTRPLGFLTDYGPGTEHVGALHAVASAIAPASARIDLAHDVPPGDIRWGAILVDRLVQVMPQDSVTVAVVDPGVGTDRRAVAVELAWGRVVIGPDNGLLGLVAQRQGAVRAVEVTARDRMREPVSQTFHGRDVFAPCAAHLAAGGRWTTWVPMWRWGRSCHRTCRRPRLCRACSRRWWLASITSATWPCGRPRAT